MRLFAILCISTKYVQNVSPVTVQTFKAALRQFLVIFTKDSIAPPILGLDTRLKYYSILFSFRLSEIFCYCNVLKAFFISRHRQS